jgi:hypothetical protein
MPDGHTADLSGSFRSSTTSCPRTATGCHGGRTPTMVTWLGRRPGLAVAASGHRGRPRAGRVTMSAVTAGPDHRLFTGGQGEVVARTPVRDVRPQTPTSASQEVPDSGRPDGSAGKSGRSIRRSLRLVTTSSTLPQGRPCGRPPAAAVLAPAGPRRPAGAGLMRADSLLGARPRDLLADCTYCGRSRAASYPSRVDQQRGSSGGSCFQ